MQDYYEKPKKKKKSDKEKDGLKPKPVRNFKIIDDDIDIRDLNANDEAEALVDLLDSDRPVIVTDYEEKPKVVQKVNYFTNNKWMKLDVCENEDGDLSVNQIDQTTMFKKRGDKSSGNKSSQEVMETYNEIDDDDLDYINRKRNSPKRDDDDDLSPVRRRSNSKKNKDDDISPVRRRTSKLKEDEDLSPVRGKAIKKEDDDLSPVRTRPDRQEEVDETKCRVRRMTKEEELKKKKKEEKMAKYAEWGKGLVQKQQRDEKLKDAVYEADKPLARYKDDKDLDQLLKKVEREDDPMLEYLRSKKEGTLDEDGTMTVHTKAKYKGPPPPLNRYNLLPGSRWDGVDRSNGFEKKYYESIAKKKALAEEAYKWSVEDM